MTSHPAILASFRLFGFLAVVLLFSACKKDVVPPAPRSTHLIDLEGVQASPGQAQLVDMDSDGSVDFVFETTQVADPVEKKTKLQYLVYSTVGTYLCFDANDRLPVLNNRETLVRQRPGFEWGEVTGIVMTQRVTEEDGNRYWEGSWKDAAHKYLPVAVQKESMFHMGWIELSFDKENGRLTLHRAGLSLDAQPAITVGE